MLATGGTRLLSVAAVKTLKKTMLPLCDLVTPNIPEAEALSGVRIRGASDLPGAALAIAAFGAGAVLIKGGHASGDSVRDLLYDGANPHPGDARHGLHALVLDRRQPGARP